MKLKTCLATALLSVGFANAQETTTTTTTVTTVIEKAKSEAVHLDNHLTIGAPALIFGMFQVSYERALGSYLGAGTEFRWAFSPLGSDNPGGSWIVSPFLRLYSRKDNAVGFFGEIFMSFGSQVYLSSQSTNKVIYNGMTVYNDNKDKKEASRGVFGIGFGLGKKWVVGENILIELSGGLGRNFIKDTGDDDNAPALTGKMMLGLGYRF
jgi:hypothetical protein